MKRAYIGYNTDKRKSEHMVPLIEVTKIEKRMKAQADFIDNYFRDTPAGKSLNDKGNMLVNLLLENIKLRTKLKRISNKKAGR